MKNRVIWKMFLLEIVTLGIYRLYWLIKTRKEMMTSNSEIKILHPIILFLPVILVIVSIIPMIVSSIQATKNTPSYCSAYSSDYNSNYTLPAECDTGPAIWASILFYLVILFLAPMIVIWLWGYAKGVEKITNGTMSFAMALLILYMVPDGIDILLIQDSFNRISNKDVLPVVADAPQAPVATQ